jgi:hypothetical protein
VVNAQLPDYRELGEPALSFDPYDPKKRDVHPLRGLATFGPFSESILGAMPDTIKLAAIVPPGAGSRVQALIAELSMTHQPQERKQYLPVFGGFEGVFRQQLSLPGANIVELPAELDGQVRGGPNPQRALAEALSTAMQQVKQRRAEWDVVLIYLPDRWRPAFEGGASVDFDLHDFIKAKTAAQAIPTQILNDDAWTYRCRASVAWRLGLALYVKAGGIPWKMEPVQQDTVFIGVSYAMRKEAGVPRYVTCCSQIFDAEGTGLEFLAYETEASKLTILGKNPFLTREQMRAVMARSLSLYLDRHPGRLPRRVVVHKNTEFKGLEIEGAFDALASIEEVELVQIQETRWRGVRLIAPRSGRGPGEADRYPLSRGTILTLDTDEALLWTQGNSAAVTGGQAWYPVGKSIPRPMLIRRYAGRGEAELLGREILALSKMNWNNDNLNDSLPATLGFARKLAEVVKRMPRLDPKPYPLRLFM